MVWPQAPRGEFSVLKRSLRPTTQTRSVREGKLNTGFQRVKFLYFPCECSHSTHRTTGARCGAWRHCIPFQPCGEEQRRKGETQVAWKIIHLSTRIEKAAATVVKRFSQPIPGPNNCKETMKKNLGPHCWLRGIPSSCVHRCQIRSTVICGVMRFSGVSKKNAHVDGRECVF